MTNEPDPTQYRYHDAARTRVIDYETMTLADPPAAGDILPYDAAESDWFDRLQRRRRGEAALARATRRRTAEEGDFTDDELAGLAELDLFDAWAPVESYAQGKRLTHGGQLYEVMQPVSTALSTQPPDAEGMLAVYRPVDGAAGTRDDPKHFVVGMDAVKGLFYAYAGGVWEALQSFLAHTGREPGTASLEAFWRKV